LDVRHPPSRTAGFQACCIAGFLTRSRPYTQGPTKIAHPISQKELLPFTENLDAPLLRD
jgi:hypothetical protein